MEIDEAYLYQYMPAVERYLMAMLPLEEELDHKFSRRFERKMKALIKYERRTPRERKFYRGMKIAFATIAVMLLVAFGSAMSVRASRMNIIEFFVEIFEELTSYSVEDDKPEGVQMVPVEPDYVPEGFVVTQRMLGDAEFFVRYENNFGDRIHYNQAVAGMGIRLWDTEASVTDEIKIGRQKISVVEENDVKTFYWKDTYYIYSIAIPGEMDVAEVIKMARSVIKK